MAFNAPPRKKREDRLKSFKAFLLWRERNFLILELWLLLEGGGRRFFKEIVEIVRTRVMVLKKIIFKN